MNPTPREVLEPLGYRADLSPQSRRDFLNVCKEGTTAAMVAWLDLGMPVDTRVEVSRETALIKAAEGGSIERMEILVARGADLEARDASDDTALRTAFNWNHPECAAWLLARGADPVAMNRWGESALEHAVDKDQSEAVKMLLAARVDGGVRSENGRCALRAAWLKDRHDLLDAMFDAGASPSAPVDLGGCTLLHLATRDAQSEAVERLTQRGARHDVPDRYGVTARAIAVELGLAVQEEWSVVPELDAQHRARAKAIECVTQGLWSEAIAALREGGLSLDTRDRQHYTALMRAAEAGDVDGVRALCEAGADTEATLPYGETAMGLALTAGHLAVVEALAAHGAKSTVGDAGLPGIASAVWNERLDLLNALPPFDPPVRPSVLGEWMRAAGMQSNVDLVAWCLDRGAHPDAQAEIDGDTTLHGACTHYVSLPVIALLLARGADVDAVDHQKATALHKCMQHYAWDDRYVEALRALLVAGARLDALDAYGRTPWGCGNDNSKPALRALVLDEKLRDPARDLGALLLAYDDGRIDDVRAWVSAGAPFEFAKDAPGEGLLTLAARRGDDDTVALLLARGADPNHTAHYGLTALSAAANGGHTAVVARLLDAGARTDHVDDWGTTVVHSAASFPSVLRLLQSRGVSIAPPGPNSPLIGTVNGDADESAALLLDAGADPDSVNSYFGTALHVAVSKGNDDAVALLLRHRARTDLAVGHDGDTALTAAAKAGNVAIVTLLLDAGADPTVKNRDGDDALALLTQRKELRTAFAAVLARFGIDVTPPTVEALPTELTAPPPFFAAVYEGDVAAVTARLDAGDDVNARDPWGATALMAAVASGHGPLLDLLLARGADVRAKDAAGRSVAGYTGLAANDEVCARLDAAAGEKLLSMDVLNDRAACSMADEALAKSIARGELAKVAAMLRSRAVNPYRCAGGASLASLAAQRGDDDLLDLLRASGVSLDRFDLNGAHPLALALSHGHEALAERLVTGDVDLSARGPALLSAALDRYDVPVVRWLMARGVTGGASMLHRLIRAGIDDLATELITAGRCDVNARDEGTPALVEAVRNWYGAQEALKALLTAGADVHAYDALGNTALHAAVTEYMDDAARQLLAHGASWDFCAPVPEAVTARALADERGLDPETWPGDAPDHACEGDGEGDGEGGAEGEEGGCDDCDDCDDCDE